MPITYERSYKASDGKCYGTLEEAQVVELMKGFGLSEDAAKIVVTHKSGIVAILTLNDSSRPKARGKAKPRKSKPDQPELPQVA